MRQPRESVVRIGFTPVKGLRHRSHSAVELRNTGPLGDRLFAFMAEGRVLRTVANPLLIGVQASYVDQVLSLDFPDGTCVSSTVEDSEFRTVDYWGRQIDVAVQTGDHAAAMSAYLGKPVGLVRAEPGALVFYDSVSVITTAELAQIAGQVEPSRFRATFTVDTTRVLSPGQWWRLGDAAVEVTGAIDRCPVVDLDPTDGRRTPGLFTSLSVSGHGRPFGVTARVVQPGVVRSGDAVSRLAENRP